MEADLIGFCRFDRGCGQAPRRARPRDDWQRLRTAANDCLARSWHGREPRRGARRTLMGSTSTTNGAVIGISWNPRPCQSAIIEPFRNAGHALDWSRVGLGSWF